MATAPHTLSAAKLRIGMRVRLADGAVLPVTGRAVLKSELHGWGGTVKECDVVWLFFAGRPKLELKPTDRLEVVE